MKRDYCLKTIAYTLSVCYCLLVCSNCIGQQNLVPNYSFEQYANCPVLYNAPPPSPWYNPTNYDLGCYYNACSSSPETGVPYNIGGGGVMGGYQYARTGNAYIGLYFFFDGNDMREYVQVQLKKILKPSRRYYAECFVSLTNLAHYGCNNIGMLFTNTAVYVDTINYTDGVLPANPQVLNKGNPVITDTLNWVKVSGIFKAQGGEQYLTLGNFKHDSQTTHIQVQPTGYFGASYYVDDVSVYGLDSFNLKADAGRDTTITIGDSAFIGTYTNGIDSIKWQILNSNGTIDSTRPGFWVHPTTNTCYVVTQTVNGYTSSDTVCVTVQPLPLKFLKYELRSTSETRNGINEQQVTSNWFTANEINVSHFYVQRSSNGRDFNIIGEVNAKGASYNEYSYVDKSPLVEGLGVVYYRIMSIDRDGKVSYSEVRIIEVRGTNYEVRLFPNPAIDVVNIECKEGIKEVKIIDCLGREMLRQAQHDGNVHHLSLNIHHYPKGLYVVQVITNKGDVRNEKLIVQ